MASGSQIGLDNKSDEPVYYDDSLETRAQLLGQKIQQLKNTSKLAKVIIVDEMPVFRASVGNKDQFTSGGGSPNNGNILSNSHKNQDEEEK